MNFKLDPILDSMNLDSLTKGMDMINELNFHQDFVVQDIGISSRVMNHWHSKGLMPIKLRIGNGKYTFNFIELIWFHIVKELRDYGYPLDKISIIRKRLMTSLDASEYFRSLTPKDKENLVKHAEEIHITDEEEKKKVVEYFKKELDNPENNEDYNFPNLLSVLISQFILYRQDIRLLIDNQGIVIPYTEQSSFKSVFAEYQTESGFDNESYITISLLKFFKKFVLNKDHFMFLCENNLLNENEAHILALVREGKAKSITIKFKNQKPFMLEVTKEQKIHAETRLSEVLLGRSYQDINIKTEAGNILFSNITTKKKLQ